MSLLACTIRVSNIERQVKQMKSLDREMWKINIENAASAVAVEYGNAVAKSVFARYGANGFYDLASCYYSEVFADLEQIANDN